MTSSFDRFKRLTGPHVHCLQRLYRSLHYSQNFRRDPVKPQDQPFSGKLVALPKAATKQSLPSESRDYLGGVRKYSLSRAHVESKNQVRRLKSRNEFHLVPNPVPHQSKSSLFLVGGPLLGSFPAIPEKGGNHSRGGANEFFLSFRLRP